MSLEVSKLETLTTAQKKRKGALIKTLREHTRSFVSAGASLGEFRDERLYKDESYTFYEYCEKKLGMDRRYVDYLIKSSETVRHLNENNCSRIENESQARELAFAPPELRDEIITEVIALGPLTASAIKKAVESRAPQNENNCSRSTKRKRKPKDASKTTTEPEDPKAKEEPAKEPEATPTTPPSGQDESAYPVKPKPQEETSEYLSQLDEPERLVIPESRSPKEELATALRWMQSEVPRVFDQLSKLLKEQNEYPNFTGKKVSLKDAKIAMMCLIQGLWRLDIDPNDVAKTDAISTLLPTPKTESTVGSDRAEQFFKWLDSYRDELANDTSEEPVDFAVALGSIDYSARRILTPEKCGESKP